MLNNFGNECSKKSFAGAHKNPKRDSSIPWIPSTRFRRWKWTYSNRYRIGISTKKSRHVAVLIAVLVLCDAYGIVLLMADTALPKSFDVHVGSDGIVKNFMFAAKGDGSSGGRGQGIQQLLGNETYQELVSKNKVRRYCSHLKCRYLSCYLIQLLAFLPLLYQPSYARCHKSDKGKVAR